MFGEALSYMESFDAYIASLSEKRGQREEGEGEGQGVGRDEGVKTLTESWLALKSNLKSVFSQKEDEIRHLQCALEKAKFSAEDHSNGVRSESGEDVAKLSPQDRSSSEDVNPKLVKPGVFPELGGGGFDSRLPDGDVGAELEQKEAPHSEKHDTASHSSEAGMELEQDAEPHSEEQEVVAHTSVTGMEQEQEAALHSEKQGITGHTPETRTPPEVVEQEIANHTGMELEIDSISFQHGIGTETASVQNLGTSELASKTLSNSRPGSSNDQIPSQEFQNEGTEMQEPTPGLQPVQ